MEIIEGVHSCFSVRNKDKTFNSEFVFFYARPRFGKSIAVESLIELYHKAGYTILCLSDVKDEWEFGYAMFEPEKKYHLDRLKREGILPGKKKVLLYHPITFNIPTNIQLPKMQLYGFGLKDLRRSEFSMISETAWESDTTRLLLDASESVPSSVGLWGFLHYIGGHVMGKKDGRQIRHDPNLFDLPITGGTNKSLQDVASFFKPFAQNYFLIPDNSVFKLDWEKILNDKKHYHIFGTCYLKDSKLKEFCVLGLLNAIITNRKKGKNPILIYIPEIRYLVPAYPEGYKKFLAISMKENISIMGNMGKGGIAGVFDSQSVTDTDENVRKAQTKTFYGELSDKDVAYVSKALKWGKYDIRPLIQSDARRESQPTFLFSGDVERGSWSPRFPSHCHAEESYDFEEMYKKHHHKNPEEYPYENYKATLDLIKKQITEERNKIRERIKRDIQKQKEEERRKAIQKQELQNEKKDNKIPEKFKEKIQKNKERDMKLVYEMYNDLSLPKSERSIRPIAEKFHISKSTVAKYLKEYPFLQKKDEEANLSEDPEEIVDPSP